MFAYGPPAGAQAVQSLYSPIIILYDGLYRYAGTDSARGWLQMHEDGSGLAQFASGGNLSHVGGAGGRYFLFVQNSADVTMPDGSPYVDCVAWHENGDPSTLRLLTSDHSLSRGDCQWSADGEHVTYGGKRFDSAGNVVESGAFMGDVEWAVGEPIRIFNERLIASDQPSVYRYVTGFSIDATSQRVAFQLSQQIYDLNGKYVRTDTFGQFVAAVPPAVEGRSLPLPATPVRIRLSTPDAERGCCSFSPVAGDYRVLYTERAPSKWPYINYFWTVNVPQQYDGSYALVPTQVTSKTNSPANYLHSNSAWSPTGNYIAYIASRNADWTVCQVYKIAADGKGKAIRLTADQDGYAGLRWRP
jgi:hypothetical protein